MMEPDERLVTASMTVDEARAILCHRADCREHLPEARSRGWQKLARATQQVTATDHPEAQR